MASFFACCDSAKRMISVLPSFWLPSFWLPLQLGTEGGDRLSVHRNAAPRWRLSLVSNSSTLESPQCSIVRPDSTHLLAEPSAEKPSRLAAPGCAKSPMREPRTGQSRPVPAFFPLKRGDEEYLDRVQTSSPLSTLFPRRQKRMLIRR